MIRNCRLLKHTLTIAVIDCLILGIPVAVVSVLVGLNNREDFITKHACWCRGDGALFVTFTGTIGLILLVSLVFKHYHKCFHNRPKYQYVEQ